MQKKRNRKKKQGERKGYPRKVVKEYRLSHYSKRERQRRWTRRVSLLGEEKRTGEWKRVSRKRWTVNRSPHGHKTAREQFGRDRWQRKRRRSAREGGEKTESLVARREKRVRTRKRGRGRERRVVEKGRGAGAEWTNGKSLGS